MIHHIVLFGFKSFPDGLDKGKFLEELKRSFEELPQHIACLKGMEVAFNINPKEPYDIMLHGTLCHRDEIELYAKHPEHVKLVEKYIKPYADRRACVDIEK